MFEHVKFAYILFFCMKMKKSVIAKFSVLQKNNFLYSLLLEYGITVFLRKLQYEVCPSKTGTRVHSGEGVATIMRNYHRHLDKCPIIA